MHPHFQDKIMEWRLEVESVEGHAVYRLQQRLKHIKLQLKKWNEEDFGNIFQAKKELETKSSMIQQEAILFGCLEELQGGI